jgi:Tfp pilus assembly PilM family ATPase
MDHSLSIRIESFGTMELPGFFQVMSRRGGLFQYADEMKAFLRDNKIRAKNVIASFGQSSVLARSTRVPVMRPVDLASMIGLEWTEYLPVSPDEYAFDWRAQNQVMEEEQAYYNLMVAGVRHDQIDQVLNLLAELRLRPVVFDVYPNAIYELMRPMRRRNVMVVEIGPTGSRLAIYKQHELFVYAELPVKYDLSIGIDMVTLKREISGHLDNFSSSNAGRPVDRLVILGEASARPEIKDDLGYAFGIPTTLGLNGEFSINFNDGGRNFTSLSGVYGGNLGMMVRMSRHLHRLEDTSLPRAEGAGRE